MERVDILLLIALIVAGSGCVAHSDPAFTVNVVDTSCYSNGWIEVETVIQDQGLGGDGYVLNVTNVQTNNTLPVNEESTYYPKDSYTDLDYPKMKMFMKAKGNLTIGDKYNLKIDARGNISQSAETCKVMNETFNRMNYIIRNSNRTR